MRTLTLLTLAVLLAHPAAAAEQKLMGAEIKTALADHVFAGSNDGRAVEQSFDASGRTLYTEDGNASQGLWEVRGDQYCSQWPPHDAWSCYDMTADGKTVTFISSSGVRYLMTLAK